MAFEYLKEKKKELGYTNRYISEKTGIPIGTVQKFFQGATKAPRMETIHLIEELLMIPERRTSTEEDQKEKQRFEHLKEIRKKAAEGSLEGYDPEEKRSYADCFLGGRAGQVEVIDGCIYEHRDDSVEHILVIGEIMIQLDSFIESKRKRDLVVINPVDVFLNKDDKTIVHPDISILQNRFMYEDGMVFGAPDLIIEVVTSASRKTDTIIKYYRYALAGVTEYWMVDLSGRYITVYHLPDYEGKVYTFDDKVPVGIWKEEAFVDFSVMKEKLEE
ncbi:MAG: Uma2 family endonuclease [Dorea sp.]|nr:Uma2 family endonuclease [Dorea sp.]